jgi:hypothetical protein
VRIAQIIAVAWLMLPCVLAPAHAEKGVALVVGNGAYLHADKLANPVNDARGMRDALTGPKFDVVYGEDLDAQALRRLIGQFAGPRRRRRRRAGVFRRPRRDLRRCALHGAGRCDVL